MGYMADALAAWAQTRRADVRQVRCYRGAAALRDPERLRFWTEPYPAVARAVRSSASA